MFLPCKSTISDTITQEIAKIEANHSIYVTFTLTVFQFEHQYAHLILSFLLLFCRDQGAQIIHVLSVYYVIIM